MFGAKVLNSKNVHLLAVENYAVGEMGNEMAKVILEKKLRQKKCMRERAVCSNISWKTHMQRERNKEAAEDGTKTKLLKG